MDKNKVPKTINVLPPGITNNFKSNPNKIITYNTFSVLMIYRFGNESTKKSGNNFKHFFPF